jgi:hypothetical protein
MPTVLAARDTVENVVIFPATDVCRWAKGIKSDSVQQFAYLGDGISLWCMYEPFVWRDGELTERQNCWFSFCSSRGLFFKEGGENQLSTQSKNFHGNAKTLRNSPVCWTGKFDCLGI